MGGVEGYVASMTLRVVEWKGFGIHILMIRSILVINLIYFVLIVKLHGVNKKEKIGFLANFIVFVILALLTSSRSTLLVNIFIMAIIYYYFVRRISSSKIVIMSSILVLFALVLGIARNGYSIDNGKFSTGLSENGSYNNLEMANFNYGLFPLEKVIDNGYIKHYYYGETYVSAVTNVIPRSIWPNKPKTGGVVFTEDYHNVHNGYSNYSTGFLVEGIINFGYFTGTLIAFLFLYITYKTFSRYSSKIRNFTSLRSGIIFFLVYPNLVFLIPTYMHGEFTTVTHTIFLNKILLIIVFVSFVIPKRLEYKKISTH